MKRAEKLGAGIYFSAQEAIPVFLLIACSFLKSFSVTALDTGASILFLSAYQGKYIPQILTATALLIFLIWPALSSLKEKDEQAPAHVVICTVAVSFVLYLSFLFSKSPLLYAGAMVWKESFFILLETAFWVVAFRFDLFNGKTKTLIGVLFAQALGILFSSFITGLIAANDVEQFILCATVFAGIYAVLLKIFVANGSAPIAQKLAFSKQKTKRSGTDSRQKKLYVYFYVLSGLLFFATGLFNYNFLTSLTSTAVNNAHNSVSVFISAYCLSYALSSLLIFGFLFLTLKGRITVFSMLYLIPASLLILVFGSSLSFLPLIITAKAVLTLTQTEGKETTLQTIPLAISLRTGFRATILRKSIIEPLSLLVCAIMLWWAESHLTQTFLTGFTIGFSIVLFVVIIAVRQYYLQIILNILKTHLWRGGRLLLTGKRVKRYLARCLNSTNSQESIYALRVMEESLYPLFFNWLKKALKHKNADVRLYALSKMEALKFSGAIDEIQTIADKDNCFDVRQTAWRVVCRLGTNTEREKAVEQIGNPEVRQGALTGLLAAGHEGVFVAIEQVAALASSPVVQERKLAATVLGDAGNKAFYHPLIALLNDEDFSVCQAALIACGKILSPHLLPAVMDIFRYPDLREDAVDVLLQFREKAFDQIDRVLHSKEYPIQFRILLAKTVGRLYTPQSDKFLFDHIQIEERQIRFTIMKSLILSGYKASGKNISTVRLCLYDEIETATGILAALDAFEKNDNKDAKKALNILASALKSEIDYVKERILLLLALIQPLETIRTLLSNYDSARLNNTDTIKIIDKILSGELRTLCLPLFEDKTVQQQLALLRPHFYPPVLSIQGYVRDIMNAPEGEFTSWTKACAAYTAGYIKDICFIDSLVSLLSDPDPVVRETSVWALGKIMPQDEIARLIISCLSDPCAPVARMTRFIISGAGKTVF